MKSLSSFFSRALSVLVLTLAATLFNIEIASAQSKPWLTENKTLATPQYACLLPGSPSKELEWEADIKPGCTGTTVSYQWYAIVGGSTVTLQDTASRITGTNLTTLTLQLPYLNNYSVHRIFCLATSAGGSCPGEVLSSDTVDLITVQDRPTLNFTSITDPICETDLVRFETAVTGPSYPKGELKYNWYVINDPAAPGASSPSGNVKTKNFSLDTTSFYTYTPDLVNDQDSIYVIAENVCGLDTAGTTLDVLPKPELAIPTAKQNILTCINDSIEFVYNITNAKADASSGGADVNWTIYISGQNADDTTLINLFPATVVSGTGDTAISFKIASWDVASGAGIYTITFDSIKNTTDGCNRPLTANNVFNITVYPQPMAQFSTDSLGVCAGVGGTFYIEVDSATFDGNNVNWSLAVTEQSGNIFSTCNIAPSANASIVPAVIPGSGNKMGAQRLEYNVPTNLAPGIYRYIISSLTSSTNSGTCTPQGTLGDNDTIEIHVFPRKTVAFSPTAKTICEGAADSVTAIFSTSQSYYCADFGSGLDTATFDFYFTDGVDWFPTSPITGLKSDSASFTANTNFGTSLAPGIYTLRADSIVNTTASHGGCTFYPSGVTHTLTVQPKPSARWTRDSVIVCQGTTDTFRVDVSNATYGANNANWRITLRERGGHTGSTGLGANCTDTTNLNAISAIINLNPQGAGNSSITYTVPASTLPGLYYYIIDSVYNTSPQSCGGTAVQDTIWIRVNPVPTVSLNPVSARVCELDSSPMTIVVSNRQQCTNLGTSPSDVNWNYWYTDNTSSSQLSSLYTSPVGPPNSSVTAYSNPSLSVGTYWVYIDSLKNLTHGCATASRPDSALFIVDPRPTAVFGQDTVDVCEGDSGIFTMTVANAYLSGYDSNWTVSFVERSALLSSSCVVASTADVNLMNGTLNPLSGFMEITGDSNSIDTFKIPSTLAPGVYAYILRDVTNNDGPCTGTILGQDTVIIRVRQKPELNITPDASFTKVCEDDSASFSIIVTNHEYCPTLVSGPAQVAWSYYYTDGTLSDTLTTLGEPITNPMDTVVGFTSSSLTTGVYWLEVDSLRSGCELLTNVDSARFVVDPKPLVSFDQDTVDVCEGSSSSFSFTVSNAYLAGWDSVWKVRYTENSSMASTCTPGTTVRNLIGGADSGSYFIYQDTGNKTVTLTVPDTLSPGIYAYVIESITNMDGPCVRVLGTLDTILIRVRPRPTLSLVTSNSTDTIQNCLNDSSLYTITVSNRFWCPTLASGSAEVGWQYFYTDQSSSDTLADLGEPITSPHHVLPGYSSGSLAVGTYKLVIDSIRNNEHSCDARTEVDSVLFVVEPRPEVVWNTDTVDVCEGTTSSFELQVTKAYLAGWDSSWTVSYVENAALLSANCVVNSSANANIVNGTLGTPNTITGTGNDTLTISIPDTLSPGVYSYIITGIKNTDGTTDAGPSCEGVVGAADTIIIRVIPAIEISVNSVPPVLSTTVGTSSLYVSASGDTICQSSTVTANYGITNAQFCQYPGNKADQTYQLNYVDEGDITDVTTALPAGSSTISATPFTFSNRIGSTGDITGDTTFSIVLDATSIEAYENFTFILTADTAVYPDANCSSSSNGGDEYSSTFVLGTRPEPRVNFSDSFLTVCEGTNISTVSITVDSAIINNAGLASESTFSFYYSESSGNIASVPACQPNTVSQNLLGFTGNTGTAAGDTSWTVTINATTVTPGIYRYILDSVTNTQDGCSGVVLADHDTLTIYVRPQVHFSILEDSAAICEGDQYEFDINVFNSSMCDSLSGIGATGSEEWSLYYTTDGDADIEALDAVKYSDNGNTTFSVTMNDNGLLGPGVYKFFGDSIANTSSPVTCWDLTTDSFVLSILPEPTVEFDQAFIEICEGDADSVSFTVANAVFGTTDVDWTVYMHLDSASAANSCAPATTVSGVQFTGTGNGTTQINLPASIYDTPGIYTYTLDSIRNDDGTFGTCGAGAASLPGNTSVTIYVYPKPQITFTPAADEICENDVTTFSIAVTNTAYCPSVSSTLNVGYTIYGYDTTASTLGVGTVINTSALSNPYTANVGSNLAAGPQGTYFIRIDSMVNSVHGCVDSTISERYDLKIDSLPAVRVVNYPAEICEDSTATVNFEVTRVRPGDNWSFTYAVSGANTIAATTVSGTGPATPSIVLTLPTPGVNNITFTAINNSTTKPTAPGCTADTAMSAISIQTLALPDVTAFGPTTSANICSGEDNDYTLTVTNSAGKNWLVEYTITTNAGMGSSFTLTDTFTGFGNGTFTRTIDVMNYASTFTDGTWEERTITLNYIHWTGVAPICQNYNLTDDEALLTVRPLPRIVLDVPDSACVTSQATITYTVYNVLNGETIDFDWNTTNPTDGPNNISNVAGPGTANQGPTYTGTFTTDPLFPTGYSDVFLTDVVNTTTGCEEVDEWSDSIRVDPASFVGQITPPYTLCSNNPDVDTIRVVNNVGRVIKYQSKPQAWGVWSDLDLNSEAITSIVLGDTSYFTFQGKLLDHTYRAIVKSGACPEDTTDFSDYVSVKIYDKPTFEMVAYDSTICTGDSVEVRFAVNVEEDTDNWKIKYTINGTSAYWTGKGDKVNAQRFIAGLSAGTYSLSIDSIFDITTGCDTAVGESYTIRVAGPAIAGTLSYDPYVCSGNAATVTWVPGTGAVKFWQTSTNGGSTWSSSNGANNQLVVSNITDTTWVRAIIENAPCSDTVHSPMGMIVPLNGIGGGTAAFTLASPGGTYCADASATLTLNVTVSNMGSGDTWTVYWLDKNVLDSASGTGNGSFNITTKVGHMKEDFDVTLTTIKIGNGSVLCSKALQNNAIAQINIIDQPNATVGTVPQELCQGSTVTFSVNVSGINSSETWLLGYRIGSASETATGTGPGNFTITSTATVTAPSSPSGNVSVTLDSIKNTSVQTSASTYCNYLLSGTKNILVYAPTAGGTAGSDQTVCVGTNSGAVSVSGNVGDILYWEYNDGGNWIQINSSASTSYTFNNLTKTTQYRAVVKNGTCASATSNTVTISIQPLPTVTISNSKPWTVCSGDSAVINFTVGNVTATATWTLNYTVEGVSASVTGIGTSGSLTVQNVTVTDTDVELGSITVTGGMSPTCTNPSLTDKIIIKVVPNPTASFTSVPAELCDGETATVTFSVNNVGSTENWTVWYTMEGTQSTWSGTGPGTFTRTTSMAVAYTTTTTPWSVNETITLDSIVNVSSGTSSGHGPCWSNRLDSDQIEVHAPSIAGTASGSATVCDGDNTGTINLSGNVGDVLYWEYSTNGGTSWTSINSSASTSLTYNDLTVTTQYRAVVKNGTCASATSNTVTITIQPLPVATITNSKPWTICSGDDVTINFNVTNLVNPSNATWTLNYTIDGVSASTNGSGSTGSFTINDVTVDDTDVEFVSISVTGGDNPQCSNFNLTDKITINVIDNPKATLTSVRQAVCNGDKVNFTIAVNNVGSADNWTVTYTFQSNTETTSGTGPGSFTFVTTNAAVNSGSTPINMAFTLTTIVNNTSGGKTSGSRGSCDSTLNDSRNVQVDPTTVGGTAVMATGTTSPVCFGSNSGTVEVTGNVGEPIRWQYSTDSLSWTNIAGPVDSQYSFMNLQVRTWFRVEVRSGQCNTEYSSPVRIDIQPLPVATITNSKPWTVCSGDNATINFNVTNLVNPSNATWTLNYTVDGVSASVNGTGASGSLTVNNVTVDDTDVEFVSISVTGGDNPQCSNFNLTDKITIKVVENPEATFTSVPNELCDGETATVTFSVNNVGSTDNWELYYTMEGTQARWSGTGPGTFTRTTSMAVDYNTTTTPWSTTETITLDSIVNKSSGTSSGHGPCYSLTLDTDSIEVHAPSIGGTTSGAATVCYGDNSGTVSLSNNVGDVLYWEYSTDGGTTWTRINSSASTSYTYNNITLTTQYRAVVKNGTCAETTSSAVTITIQPLPVATITNSKPWTVCSGDAVTVNFSVSNLVAPVGGASWTLNYTVDGVAGSVNGSGATGSFTIPNVINDDTDVEFVSIVVTGGNNPQCANYSLTDKMTIKVIANPKATITSVPGQLCNGDDFNFGINVSNVGSSDNWTVTYTFQSNTETVSGTGPGNFTVSTTATVVNSGSSAINMPVTLTKIVNNTSGGRTSGTRGSCDSTLSDSKSIQIDPTTVGGSASLAAGTTSPVCEGQNSGTVQVSGHVGNVVRWQYSTDSTNWTNMPQTASTTANFNNISVRTWYRAEIKSGVCDNAFSTPVRVDIQKLPTLTVNTSNISVCAGVSFNISFNVHNVPAGNTFVVDYNINGTPATFTGVSTSFTSSTHSIASAGLQRTADYTFTGIRITNGTPMCSNTINENTKVTVNDLPNATLVSFSDKICETDKASFTVNVSNVKVNEGWTINYNINGGTTSLTPFTGTGPGVFKFDRTLPAPSGSNNSVTNNINFELITNNATNCTNVFDSTAAIRVDKITNPGSTVSGSATVCSGTNSGTIVLSSNNGNILRWESSQDGGSTWSNINNTNGSYSFSNLTKTTQYRVLVQNGACDAKYSDTATVTVNELPVATISGSTTICEGSTATLSVTVSNTYGNNWEITYLDSNVKRNWTGTGNGTFTFTVGPLKSTRDFTLQGIKLTSGAPQCENNGLTNNATATVTVNPLPYATIIDAPDSICENSSAVFTINVSNVKTTESWRLQYRLNNVTQTAITGTGSGAFRISTANLIAPVAGIRLFTITNTSSTPNCTQALADSIAIRVDQQSIGGTLTSALDTVCKNNGTTLTVSGIRGVVVKWQHSIDNVNWSDIANISNTYNTGNLTRTTYYRVAVKNGACDIAYSSVKTIVVNELPTLTVTPTTTSICSGSTVDLTFSVANSNGQNWRVDYKANGTPQTTPAITGTGGASTTVTFGPLTTTTDYDFVKVYLTSGSTNTRCESVITEKTKVIVIDNPNATLLSATDSLCTGSSATVNVNVSDVKTAENWSLIYSINGVNQAAVTGSGPGNFNFTTPALTTIGNNVIRLVSVTNTSSTPNCSSTLTDSITVRVDDNTVAGTLTTNNNKGCYNSNSGTLTLAGNTGRVIRWEFSEDNGQTWSTLSNNANTLDYLNLLRTTTYRVLVKNGACAAVYSNNITITIIPEPTAVITGAPEVCTGTTAQFLVTVSNVANGESWSLTYTENGVTKTLTGTGSGTVTLTTGVLNYTSSPSTVTIDLQSITNVTQGCTNSSLSSSSVGTITPRPVVSYTQSNECADSAANFVSTSSIPEGSIVAYRWTFGDGNTSGNSNATNAYSNAGVYTVKLVATSDNGCQDSATSSITIFSNPVADFDLANSCLNTDASFNSTSTVVANPGASSINSYAWNFGDGSSSTTQSPTIRYNNSGTYDVTLTVSTNNGCTDEVTKQITIYPVPNANFIASEPCENDAMNFTNTTTVDDGTSTYEWDFAGQGTSTDTDPAYTFTGFGSFNVELIATSNFGCKDTFSRTVIVNPLPTADFNVADVCIGQPSNFVNASSVPTGSITEHYWNLGDTTFDGLINPTHTYANAGTYNATLRVVTDKGCEATVTKPAVVNPLPEVVITPNGPLDFCDGDSVSLTVSNGINTGLRSQNWSTGETTVSITAKTGGFYNVRITDLNGCENEDSIEVIVYANPIADAGRDTAIDKGASVQLDGSGGLTYSWTPTTYLDNPNIPNPLASRMEQTTTYVLSVVDVNGCTDDDSVTITVLDRFNLKVYNLVTPNGDGANDTWWIENIWAYPDAEVVIVNRYGMEVFRTTGYQNDWDGKYNGNELPDGAYYYIITIPGSDKVYKGAINLVRTN